MRSILRQVGRQYSCTLKASCLSPRSRVVRRAASGTAPAQQTPQWVEKPVYNRSVMTKGVLSRILANHPTADQYASMHEFCSWTSTQQAREILGCRALMHLLEKPHRQTFSQAPSNVNHISKASPVPHVCTHHVCFWPWDSEICFIPHQLLMKHAWK